MSSAIIRISLLVILAVMPAFLAPSVQAQTLADIETFILNSDEPTSGDLDLNQDGTVDVADLVTFINPRPFTPDNNVEVEGGVHNFTLIDIPSTVTVTLLGDVVCNVEGDINIDGNIVGDCFGLQLLAQGIFTINGDINTQCASTTDTETAGDVIIQTNGGAIIIGDIGSGSSPMIESSGEVTITDDPSMEDWELDVLDYEQALSLTPPGVSITADTLIDSVVPGFPIEVAFDSQAADPDDGPITYSWDFGDGTNSTEEAPLHEYTCPGCLRGCPDRDRQ
jgi:hypothetical protein